MKNPAIDRRKFLRFTATTLAAAVLPRTLLKADPQNQKNDMPNFIIIFCDDLGYGDIGCFGSKKHNTPNIDQMAEEGIKFTSFYVTSGVCTPSRSSLMTGCYPRRVNMHQDAEGDCVLFPVGKKGLNPDEITIAELLKDQGYATACIGKWHLGDQPQFLPTRQGFDYYYGIPYSNDMGLRQGPDQPPLPLLKNEKVIEAPANQNTLTKRYAEQTINFIRENKERPFFIYMPHTMPHNPIHAGEEFRGKSKNAIYGDATEEIDFYTGQIFAELKKLNLDEKTLVIFTSDNGASSNFGGSNSPLRGWKGSTWEGGMREPFIARWPGKIPPKKVCDELATTMDLLPTFALLAGTKPPTDRIIDGKNIWPLLSAQNNAKTPHEAFYYYQMDQLQAVRSGNWKLHLPLKPKKRNWGSHEPESPLQLYNLKTDIAESKNIADKHPDIVKRLMTYAEKARQDLGDNDRPGKNQRPAAFIQNPKQLLMSSE